MKVRLRVATWNLCGGRPPGSRLDLDGAARLLREIAPDVAGLQEVHRRASPRSGFQDQPGRLRRLLGGEVAFRSSFGIGPVGYGNAVAAPAGLRAVRRVRLPGRGEPRALVEAAVSLHGRVLRFATTHLSTCPRQRLRQSRAIAARAAASELPFILAGDLNGAPESDELEPLLRAGLGHCAGAETYPSHAPWLRLDSIAVSHHFRVERCFVVATTASDHLPLVADLVLEDPEAARAGR